MLSLTTFMERVLPSVDGPTRKVSVSTLCRTLALECITQLSPAKENVRGGSGCLPPALSSVKLERWLINDEGPWTIR